MRNLSIPSFHKYHPLPACGSLWQEWKIICLLQISTASKLQKRRCFGMSHLKEENPKTLLYWQPHGEPQRIWKCSKCLPVYNKNKQKIISWPAKSPWSLLIEKRSHTFICLHLLLHREAAATSWDKQAHVQGQRNTLLPKCYCHINSVQ